MRPENTLKASVRNNPSLCGVNPIYADPPYGLWSIWRNISYLYRGIVLMLAAVSIYSAFSTLRSVRRLHAVWTLPNGRLSVIREVVASAIRSQWNVRQLTITVFYLFGVVLFLGLQTVGQTSLERFVVGSLVLHFAFATNIFSGSLVLHLFHWSALAILKSLSARLEKRDSVQHHSTAARQ